MKYLAIPLERGQEIKFPKNCGCLRRQETQNLETDTKKYK